MPGHLLCVLVTFTVGFGAPRSGSLSAEEETETRNPSVARGLFAVSIAAFCILPFGHSYAGEEKTSPSSAGPREAPKTIVLSRAKDGRTLMDGKTPFYGEVFAFDEKTNTCDVARGAELRFEDCPVPLRIVSMGYSLSGSFSAVYKNVILNCSQLPADSILYIARVAVQKDFSYQVKINRKGCEDVYVSADNRVFPGKGPSSKKCEPCVELLVSVQEVGQGQTEARSLAGAHVTIGRATGKKIQGSTLANGQIRLDLSQITEKVLSLEVEHPQTKQLAKYPLPISLRGLSPGLVIYKVEIKFVAETGESRQGQR